MCPDFQMQVQKNISISGASAPSLLRIGYAKLMQGWNSSRGRGTPHAGPWPRVLGPGPMAQGPWPRPHGPWPRARGPGPVAQSLKWGKIHFVPKWRKLRNSETQELRNSETQNPYLASPNDRELNLLSNGPIESFWGAMWLGIQPFLCFTAESRRIVCRCLQTKRGAAE